jgi:hypothetical protein
VNRPAPWSIADVLDFEYLLSTESETGDERARQRDRALYLQQIAPHLPPRALADRAVVFRRWLELRRDSPGTESPGRSFNTGWQTLLTVAVLAGLFLGGGVTTGVLHYHENEPVNVIEFLKWTLLPQWLFLLGALLFLVLRRGLGWGDRFEPLRALMRAFIEGLAALVRRLPGEKRAMVSRTLARIREHRERYGGLATWPLVIVTQLFAVCFNLGILGTLLTEVTVRELRFGWQTTLEIQPGQASRLVTAFATPWAWAPQAHPTRQQTAHTLYAPGQRHDTLPPGAMRSWWPFLVYAVAFYGLGLRGALLLYAAAKLHAALRGLAFDYPEANALWHRLVGPVFASEPTQEQAPRQEGVPTEQPKPHPPGGPCWVLLAEELQIDEAALRDYLANTYGWNVEKLVRVKIDNRRASAGQFEELRAAAPALRAAVVVASIQRDPIVAIALFLKEMLGSMGKGVEGLLLLAGSKPDLPRLKFWHDFKAEHQLRIGIEIWQTT